VSDLNADYSAEVIVVVVVPDEHNAMDVIRHHHECIKLNIGKAIGQGFPRLPHRQAGSVLTYYAVEDLPEEAGSLMGTDCEEVRACPTIVVSLQAQRAAVPWMRGFLHRGVPGLQVTM
jgi:hypothetical protein